MPQVTLGLGIMLIVLGVVGYYGTGQVSFTALIPSFFGAAFVVLGLLAAKPCRRKHVMHASATLALLGAAGSFPGVLGLIRMLRGVAVDRPAAKYAQAAMALLCVVYLVLCVRSFVQARRQRTNGAERTDQPQAGQ